MKTLLFIALFLSFSSICFSQALTFTTVGDKTIVKPGEILTITTTIKNTFNPVPITITASATYNDSYGVQQTSNLASITLTVNHPMTTTNLTVPIPTAMSYVANSAKIDGVFATVATSVTTLTIPFTKTITDQGTCVVVYQFQAK